MADTFKKLVQGLLNAGAATIYTAPAGKATIIRSIRVVNTDAVSRWFTLYQGGTAAANQILGQTVLGPNETYVDTGPIILGTADTLGAAAEVAGKLCITVSGVESS